MQQLPFTHAGVQELQERLYALPDSTLQQEAARVLADFSGWVLETFLLTTQQQAYLQRVDEDYLQTIAMYVSHFIAHRLPMELHPAEHPTEKADDDDQDSSKLFLFNVEENGSSSPEEPEGDEPKRTDTYHGKLTITFRYPD